MGQRELAVAVVYATPDAEDLTELVLPSGATVQDAVDRSGVLSRHPPLAAGLLELGIWGRVVPAGQQLSDGDRVEIYRPLTVEPKEARRVRAAVRRRRSAG